jgi:hypothetical protein
MRLGIGGKESTNSGARQLRPISHAQEFSYEYQSDFGQQFLRSSSVSIRPSSLLTVTQKIREKQTNKFTVGKQNERHRAYASPGCFN